ncbi:MAG TPA: metal-dependent hydrolase [Candidatus Krumholzibacteria bacterium]|nr:metal-dependent hydrolase [Candidatus Krumholzibacteria bacterium]
MRLVFHGHSCWEMQGAKHRVLIDPYLSDNPLADVGPTAFARLDAIVLSHGHGDHIGDTEAIAKKTGALVVANFEIANYFAKRGCLTHGMSIGGGFDFSFGRVKLVIAHHGSTGPGGEALGSPAGIVLAMDGKKIYHAGDTGVFLDMQLISELNGPFDACLLPIGDNFTMGIDDAVKACELIRAKLHVPMHYNTFPAVKADAGVFVRKVEAKGLRARVVEPGGSIEV